MSNLAQPSQSKRVIFSWQVKKEKNSIAIMKRTFRELRNDVRTGLVRIARSLTQRFASRRPSAQSFASPRMCPFCGLITPRTKSSCLECGKSLAPAG
jgi:hypothetical protein